MAHFAKLDENNVVIEVIVVDNSDILNDAGVEDEEVGKTFLENITGHPRNMWAQTSYNRNFRRNYAGMGMIFDAERNAFIMSKPYPSWLFDELNCSWYSPVPEPVLEPKKKNIWHEDTLSWEVQDL
jgi:hypothetical protein